MIFGPKLYQLLHWWHRLAYGNNAAAVQACCVLVAGVAVIVYTLDGKRVRWLQEESRRLAEEPILIVTCKPDITASRTFTAHNYGRGTALHVQSWITVDKARVNFGVDVRLPLGTEVDGLGDIKPNGEIYFKMTFIPGPARDQLACALGFDRFGRWHQSHVLFQTDGYIQSTFLRNL